MSGLAPAARNSVRMGLGAGGGHRQILSALGGNDDRTTASMSLTQEHHGITLFVNDATGPQVFTLPKATASMAGLKFTIMNAVAPSNGASFQPDASQKINAKADGAALANGTPAAGDYHTLIFDGTQWRSLDSSGTWT